MKAKILTIDNKQAGEIELVDDIYGREVRSDILNRMVNYQLAKRRAGTHKVKTRSEIRGTGSKIFRQKGSGNARHGNRKVSQFIGGGRAFGPVVRSHAHDLTKKMRKLAMKIALSAKLAAGKLIVLDDAACPTHKTKELSKKLEILGIDNALFVTGVTVEENFAIASRNLKNINVLPTAGANVYDILKSDKLVLTKAAVEGLEARLK